MMLNVLMGRDSEVKKISYLFFVVVCFPLKYRSVYSNRGVYCILHIVRTNHYLQLAKIGKTKCSVSYGWKWVSGIF